MVQRSPPQRDTRYGQQSGRSPRLYIDVTIQCSPSCLYLWQCGLGRGASTGCPPSSPSCSSGPRCQQTRVSDQKHSRHWRQKATDFKYLKKMHHKKKRRMFRIQYFFPFVTSWNDVISLHYLRKSVHFQFSLISYFHDSVVGKASVINCWSCKVRCTLISKDV